MTAAMRWTISLLGPRWLTAEEMSCKAAVAVAVAVEAVVAVAEAVVAVAEAVVAVVEAVVVVVVAVAMESVEAAIDGAVDVSTTELHWLYKTANPSPQSTK